MSSSSPRQQPSILERVLGLITEVRPGESAGALLLTLNVFLLLAAYYVMKPVREGLILELKGGAELKSWMSAAMTVLLVFLVPAYSAFANRVRRNRLVVAITLFFASHLLLFWLGSSSAWIRERIGLVFFVWIGIFSMMAVAQFWAFSNDQYTEEQGKRLFALLGLGASLGAWRGASSRRCCCQPSGCIRTCWSPEACSPCALGSPSLPTSQTAGRERRQKQPKQQAQPASPGMGVRERPKPTPEAASPSCCRAAT
ncbi:MAG: hypothetical protein AB7S68_22005 [Polyangiaceae bacterium]